MNTAAGSRITVGIGVLAICLAAISPADIRAAEPVKQEKKAKSPAQTRTSSLAPQATASKFASAGGEETGAADDRRNASDSGSAYASTRNTPGSVVTRKRGE